MGRPRLTITKADNGFIIKVFDHGKPAFKEPYQKGYFVFHDYQGMFDYLEIFFGLVNEEESDIAKEESKGG